MADWFATTTSSGTMLFAVPIAILAGFVSFASPCIIPLLPGYFSYITGMAATDLATARRSRMLVGSVLFVVGFSVVFVSYGALFGAIGFKLLEYQRPLSIVLGIFTIVLGLAFMGAVPFMQRDLRLHKVPAVGVAAAPLLGGIFAIGWTPCLGPTLTAVLGLATTEGTAGRGAVLAFAYCMGLGIPFIVAAVGFRSLLGENSWLKRHQQSLNIFGGVLMILVGVLLATGLWGNFINTLRVWGAGFVTFI
ncbi:cytochrome c biogenesis protein CcdA [soil metagenome]